MVHSMMSHTSFSISLWWYALEATTDILNLVPTKKVAKTSHGMWTGKPPSLIHILISGCEFFVRHETQDKLEPMAKKCIFIV